MLVKLRAEEKQCSGILGIYHIRESEEILVSLRVRGREECVVITIFTI